MTVDFDIGDSDNELRKYISVTVSLFMSLLFESMHNIMRVQNHLLLGSFIQ